MDARICGPVLAPICCGIRGNDAILKLAELINVRIEHPHVRSLELQVSEIQHPLYAEIEIDFFGGHWQGTPLGAMGGLACAAVVHLVRVMRSNGRRLDFLGLTGTMLGVWGGTLAG